jgi:ethanolamine utilization protein EutN
LIANEYGKEIPSSKIQVPKKLQISSFKEMPRMRWLEFGAWNFFGIWNLEFGIFLMLLARVEGNVVATRKHPSLDGWRLVICQPINNAGEPEGAPQVAIDPHGAGMHQRVIISSDGLATRRVVGDDKSPARWMITGIVDEKEPGVPV